MFLCKSCMHKRADIGQSLRFKLWMLFHPPDIERRRMRQYQRRFSIKSLITKNELLKAAVWKQLSGYHCTDNYIQLIINSLQFSFQPCPSTDTRRLLISLCSLTRIAVTHGGDIKAVLIIKLCILNLIPFSSQLFPAGIIKGQSTVMYMN